MNCLETATLSVSFAEMIMEFTLTVCTLMLLDTIINLLQLQQMEFFI